MKKLKKIYELIWIAIFYDLNLYLSCDTTSRLQINIVKTKVE